MNIQTLPGHVGAVKGKHPGHVGAVKGKHSTLFKTGFDDIYRYTYVWFFCTWTRGLINSSEGQNYLYMIHLPNLEGPFHDPQPTSPNFSPKQLRLLHQQKPFRYMYNICVQFFSCKIICLGK